MCNQSRGQETFADVFTSRPKKMSRKVPKVYLLMMVLKVGWEKITKGETGELVEMAGVLWNSRGLLLCHASTGVLGWVASALPMGAEGARFRGCESPLPNAKPGLGANRNMAVFLKQRGVLFAVQQDKKTRPIYSAEGFYSDQLSFNLLVQSERQTKT